uniref:PH domain-containing protein n=1 Tax=Coccidioides posadasii RMSCC 3488 TaxID=454284 RepID=A0A0J6FLT9_COCPO|nr:PH domain-containing protein [Coccidioides posadasii RMSCC 3488]
MGRLRVLSFISAGRRGSKNNPPSPPTPQSDSSISPVKSSSANGFQAASLPQEVPNPVSGNSPRATPQRPNRTNARPVSTVLQQQQQQVVPSVDAENVPLPELEPIFSYLNSQSGKLYYEGYFFKLNDLDNEGSPCTERKWTEYFAQLVGTVLSLWEPAALDAAGSNGEAIPTFINVADASIKMIENLPTRTPDSRPLQNVLSISTAGKNRYLLHFNSLNALTQWTAAIRLTMFENTLLQESYTGALIAGKGKSLNNIKAILERTTFKYEDWVRVRFGPGTPWRRCWCVVSQADEKETQKHKKAQKKKSAYDRPQPPPKGNIKFYSSKKTKKLKPIATITDAFSAFAIYPQSRPLINQSTLVKVEGQITIHTQAETTAEGFVFVLPELHAAVSGFEIMLRWLFPVFDAFHLYGRPTRLLADTVSTRSLMFAMPTNKRNGYLDTLDVATLIHTDGSRHWSEREWRQQMKEATSRRMTSGNSSRVSSISGRRGPNRSSLQSQNGSSLRFEGTNGQPVARRLQNNHSSDALPLTQRHNNQGSTGAQYHSKTHTRAASDNTNNMYRNGPMHNSQYPYFDSTLPEEESHEGQLQPPNHGPVQVDGAADGYLSGGRSSSDSEIKGDHPNHQEISYDLKPSPLPVDLTNPPVFSHNIHDKPHIQPKMSPELKQAGSRISHGTLSQMVAMNQLQNIETPTTTGWDEKGQSISIEPPGIAQGHGASSPERTMYNGNAQFPRPVAADASSSHYSSPTSPIHSVRDGIPLNYPDDPVNANFSPNTPRQSPQMHLQIDTNRVANRNPVPTRQDGSESPSTKTISSLGSLRKAIDMDALNLLMTRERTPSPPPPPQRRFMPDVESTYDQGSTTTPDYASSHKSSVSGRSAKSVARPRMGRKRVVGTPEPTLDDVIIGDTRYVAGSNIPEPNPNIPLVDFGPTHTYSPGTGRPSTGGTLALLSTDKNSSEPNLGKSDKRSTWFGMENKPAKSPGHEERRRSFLWQPGMVDSSQHSPGAGLTPEQFVEQRASSGSRGASPVYNHYHHRDSSRHLSSRPVSGDWANQSKQQPMNQVNHQPPRPSSRGSTIMLNQPDLSPHLSAREQEHVARVTGSSFFNMDKEASKRASMLEFGSGLVSAIDAREREKQAMKEGYGGQMVQQAIMQRQYQGQFQPNPQPMQHPMQQPQLQFQPQPQPMLHSSASQYQLPMNQYSMGSHAASVYNLPTRSNAPSRYHRFSKSQDRLQFM